MKKTLSLLITFLLCVSVLAGCSSVKYKGPLSCISHVGTDGVISLMDMTEDAQAEILSVLNRGKWIDGVTNCFHDYEFTTKNETIRYHSECGTFIDITNGKAMELSDEDRAKINKLLGVSDCMEPGVEPVKYTCDLSKYPTNEICMGYGEVKKIAEGKLLISPGSNEDKITFGEVVWLVCDQAYAYSVGQVVTYTFRDVKAPDNECNPLNIIALLVYME